ncbi:DNA-processing protein DprA [Mycolicibacterium brumae]|uniref:DNA-protecting protein DprA n=1 Tax=Mycolicibacterium brumae TaxID=85968 RepID=A0A2G5P8I0_9MYCO|nr:DNA-processing protein DprA [Mycolicibacterium brumae]MCV7193906.1 DNA-protecting protein DprA [Mycolicibacterium brumae]PIB74652.1 DNA-protecting protein DprA [Mycolicibacterium brumae]RWA21823.1 hypothetical protein MBRU_14055 [Mycolicibacterium brumae DSM 44177]UWW08109.1 DNA-processing protein DprA [Mycolicibacterium brumae]
MTGPAGGPDATLRAWAYLARVAEPPCPELIAFVRRVGPQDAAHAIWTGAEPESLTALVAARRETDCSGADLDLLANRGGRLLTFDDDEWPAVALASFRAGAANAKREANAPLALWLLGPARLDQVAERAVTMVGTRAATCYGEQVAGDLTVGVVDRDFAVVSGGAYGIDAAAHRAALAVDGVTAAVLACGIDVPYPAGHSALLHRISQRGLLVTEYPPGVRPARYRFLTRNRLAAALSRTTVVVEAGLRSGAANTAAWARMLGRGVCAVPGPVTSAASAGCHEMLRNGEAELVTRAEHVIELAGRCGELAEEPEHPATVLDHLTPLQQRVYEALPGRGAATVEQIALGAALPPEQVLGPLALLELSGLAESRDGRWRIRRERGLDRGGGDGRSAT